MYHLIFRCSQTSSTIWRQAARLQVLLLLFQLLSFLYITGMIQLFNKSTMAYNSDKFWGLRSHCAPPATSTFSKNSENDDHICKQCYNFSPSGVRSDVISTAHEIVTQQEQLIQVLQFFMIYVNSCPLFDLATVNRQL